MIYEIFTGHTELTIIYEIYTGQSVWC
jgi:hypothetical protein